MSFDIRILCDGNGCDALIDTPFSTVPKMELSAGRSGWTKDDEQPETHYCKACTQQSYTDELKHVAEGNHHV